MSNQFRTKQFQKLRDKWYARLEKEGFQDVEQTDGKLKVWESTAFQNRYDPKRAEASTEYFRLAGQFNFDHDFESPRDKLIWEMYSNGEIITDISSRVKCRRYKKWSRAEIHHTIKKLENEMLAKYGKKDNRPKRINNN